MLKDASRDDLAAPTEMAGPASSGRVLVVEDERELLELYSELLLEARFDVAAACSAEGALHALEAGAVDVVLTDVTMPGASGVDLLRAVRERGLDVPVVLVTGNPSFETAVQALELGASRYLVKPVARGELVTCVENAARLHRLTAARHGALRHLGPQGVTCDRAGLEAVYGRALASLHMVYQPILRTRDGSLFAWEALLRTRETAIGGPLAFLDMAERLGRVRELGRAIRASVTRTASRTRGRMFFINLHPEDLLDETLYDPASPLSALAPEIVLELTERSPIEDVPDMTDRVRRLRKLGFRLAIDDLGAGYAGLTSFASLRPDFVKLDRGLVNGLDREPIKRKLVASIADVGREMGITVVAEGIETPAERDAAAELGCDLMQGFLFRSPAELPLEEGFAPRCEGGAWTSQSQSGS